MPGSKEKEEPLLHIRTANGPVGLRQKRKPVDMKVEKRDVTIQKDWMRGRPTEEYLAAVKQSMLVAAEQIKLADARDPVYSAGSPSDQQAHQVHIENLLAWRPPPLVVEGGKHTLQGVDKYDRKREMLVKFSKKFCVAAAQKRVRSFIIEGESGELLYYRSTDPNAKLKDHYKLKDAECEIETKESSQIPKWEPGYEQRLRVDAKERRDQSKNPLYLYTKQTEKIQHWKRAFRLAKILVNDLDRRALKVAIARASSASLVKAWVCLVRYFQEISSTRGLVKKLAFRMMKVDLSRGWTKLQLVNKKKADEEKKKQEQQHWAARFMSQKLNKIGGAKVKAPAQVREQVISTIQSKFRRYREDMIFDRRYVLNHSALAQVQQAKVGRSVHFALQGATSEEAVRLSMAQESRACVEWETHKDLLVTKRFTYSETNLPLTPANAYVSDNMTSLAFSMEVESAANADEAYSALNKADWSKFVNLDRVSSIMLHTAPLRATSTPTSANDAAVWCTICGPRLAWDKCLKEKSGQPKYPVGAKDGFQVPRALTRGDALDWVNFGITLKSVNAKWGAAIQWDLSQSDVPVSVVVHVLGFAFRTKAGYRKVNKTDREIVFNLSYQAAVPISSPDQFVALDGAEIGLEIFEDSEGTTGQRALLFMGTQQLSAALKCGKGEFALAKKIQEPKHDVSLPLLRPDGKQDGHADFTVEPQIKKGRDSKIPFGTQHALARISPEFLGGGVPTSFYTSHRSAWYDPELGPGKFRADHVANFVQLTIGALRFASSDKVEHDEDEEPAETEGEETYHIRASTNGACATTLPLHRPGEKWPLVLGISGGDPSTIKFAGSDLFLPLPPGCWGNDVADLRRITVEVVKRSHSSVKEENFATFMKRSGKTAPPSKQEVVYRAVLTFDHNMIVDRVKPVSVLLADAKKEAPMDMNVFSTNFSSSGEEAMLSLDFALRDRDYVKAAMGKAKNRRALCIGDKALLLCEEPVQYPKDALEFRKRFCLGQFDPKASRWPDKNRGAPLRAPCLSSEYAESGLGEVNPKHPFVQAFIPKSCTDMIPHKFALPLTEKEFIDKSLPGCYTRIVQDLITHPELQGKHGHRSGYTRPVVDHLSHMYRQIPVSILATYADDTCDLELAADFMELWQRQPHRKISVPGTLKASPLVQGKTPRAILLGVPLAMMRASSYAGINVYDTSLTSTADALEVDAPQNDFNFQSAHPDAQQGGRKFRIAAGPLPPDASPAACQYEWAVRVRLPSQEEMFKFVAMIRRCVRLDHFQQASKMLEYQSLAQDKQVVAPVRQGPTIGGQLDVVLLEARRLMPRQSLAGKLANFDTHLIHSLTQREKVPSSIRPAVPVDDEYLPKLQATTAGAPSRSTPTGSKVTTYVNFKLKNIVGGDARRQEVVSYKGQKVQMSCTMSGTDSPSWASAEDRPDLQRAGGWTFKTGHINPEKMPDLIIQFEVMQAHVGFPTLIGFIQLPVTSRNFLTNPDECFKNLWLPLVTMKTVRDEEEDGQITEFRRPVANPTGEIHIMTRWLPAEKMQVLTDGSMKQQMSVRSHFLKEIWAKVCHPRVFEPIYNMEALYLNGYNPNLVPEQKSDGSIAMPETVKDYHMRHVEELANTVEYLDCLDRRQVNAWEEFEARVGQGDMGQLRLAELRQHWHKAQDLEALEQLQELLQQGIPANRREQLWSELTLAKFVFDQDGEYDEADQRGEASSARSEKEYQSLLDRGLGQRSDAMTQLSEDVYHLASTWDTSGTSRTHHQDVLMRRLKRAQNVCTALLALEDSGVVYCESLLILAFFFLLPQGTREERAPEDVVPFSESSAFWILYTLIQKAYREYYGASLPPSSPASQDPLDDSPHELQPVLVSGSGALQDLSVLECCVAYHMNDLWQHMTALGFQYSTVFYGAFMRLYATYMPTASVFRFWDILLASSTDPSMQPTSRTYIIDLAFGIIRSKRELLMACKSALEIRNLLLGVMGSLYDTSTVVDITVVSHRFLWEGTSVLGNSKEKIGSLWTRKEDMFKMVNQALSEQNEVLKQLTHMLPFGDGSVSKLRNAPQRPPGATVRDITTKVLPQMLQEMELLKGEQQEPRRHWAMFRPMPLATRILGEVSVLQETWARVGQKLNVKTPVLDHQPWLVGPRARKNNQDDTPMPGLELAGLTAAELNQVFERMIVKTWCTHSGALWNAFSCRARGQPAHQLNRLPIQTPLQKQLAETLGIYDPSRNKIELNPDDKISLNELFMSFICASKGTIGEKASALFSIYSYSDPIKKESHHIRPTSRLARTIASGGEGEVELPRAPPADIDSAEARQNCIALSVMTNHPKKHRMGVVFIQSLTPFIGSALDEPQFMEYNIWGEHNPNFAGKANRRGANMHDNAPGSDHGLEVLGVVLLSVVWIPKLIRRPETGQLNIIVKSIKFDHMLVGDYYKMNPWIEARYLGLTREAGAAEDERVWKEIPRWDPRGLWKTDQHHSYMTYGPYGGIMEWEKTMKENVVSGILGHHDSFSHHWRGGQHMGYDSDTREWQWNDLWGNQRSADIELLPEFVTVSKRKNCVSLDCVRLITQCILNRCVLNLTNREALLIADSVFSRSGAVPGFLEAIIVQGEPSKQDDSPVSLSELKERLDRSRQSYKVVTREVMLEHERQIKDSGGSLNLFSRQMFMRRTMEPINISHDMQIRDPFPGKQKELWIRFVRGGDGERCTAVVSLEPNGNIVPSHGEERADPEIELSAPGWVSKEEFVSCVMGSPLLGESLRRLGSCDHVPHERKAIPLSVTIMDPHHEEDLKMMEDALDAQQSFLLEVWDSDVVSRDFLGEAWLPPLGTLSSAPKSLVLPLARADYSEEAEFGPSRHDKNKELGDETKNPLLKVTGELYVTASWKYPILHGDDEDAAAQEAETEEARAARAMKEHSGLLTLKIERARGLRRSDGKRMRACDPQVRVWQRNDVRNMWRKRPMMKTKVISNNANPEWHFEESKEIMTGDYESRFPPPEEGWTGEVTKLLRTRKQQRILDNERNAQAVKMYGNGLKVTFHDSKGPPKNQEDEAGGHHKVQVLLTDTIHDFKDKLALACKRESQHYRNLEGEQSKTHAAAFSDIEIGPNHLVMVWIPSASVQRLAAQKMDKSEEYARAHRQSEKDPSCWKPLDPARTFAHYPKHFGTNLRGEVPQGIKLRCVEATEAYRNANIRYKMYMEEMEKTHYPDVNTAEKCYGWAKYKHNADGDNSTEWRPAFISNVDVPDTSPRYKVRWILDQTAAEEDPAAAPPGAGTLHRGTEVLIAPRNPKLGMRQHPAHKEFLVQIKLLRESRKSDFEIKDVLNKLLLDKWRGDDKFKETYGDKEPGAPGGVPLITVENIRAFLQSEEETAQGPSAKT